ncbi:MAG TPA: DUF4191 domain-containing protein [Pseudonocardiaceae bacterium]
MAGERDKAAVKEASRAAAKARAADRRAKWSQTWQAFNMQRREDKWLIPLMVTPIVLGGLLGFLIGLIWGVQWMALPLGVVLGVLIAVIIFGRRVQNNVFGKAEGQPGAAGWVLGQLRGKWNVTQAVVGTAQLDAVHRAIGPAGIVLVAEGAPHRVKGLLAQEKKRVARVVGTTPIYDIIVGNDEGQVPLRRLQRHIMKLPRNINGSQIDSLETRLAALNSKGMPLPKGPLPPGAKMRSMQRAVKRR